MEKYNKKMGERIRALRIEAGLNQMELGFLMLDIPADQTYKAQQLITRIETGKRAVKAAELPLLCKALNVEVGDLI